MASNRESSRQGHTYAHTTVYDGHFHQGDNIYMSNETRQIDCREALLLKDPFIYRESLKNDKGERASGTCEWIRENEIYKSWLDGDEHRLWICGGPGKGKTMLSIFLTEEFERKQPKGEHGQDTTLLYFFCTNGNENYNNAIAVLRGLAYQLLSKHPDISTSVSPYFETAKHTENTLSSPEALWIVFKTLLRAPNLGTVYCILDGLDECDEKSIRILVKQFRDFYSPSDCTGRIAKNLKLAIVSRKINGIEDFSQIRLDPDHDNRINEDIKRFISTAMQELSRRPGYDDNFLKNIENFLLRQSNGTFLWIGFVMNEILGMSTRMEVMGVLKALPQGLPAMYGRMLRQIKSSQRHILSTILTCVTMARRPMTLEELKTAVSFLCNTPIDSTPIMRDRIASCGSILQTSDGQDACNLVHQSARDYLLREEVDDDPILEEFRIKRKEAHASLARTCLACIENSDFRHKPLDIMDPLVLKKWPLLGYATIHWPEHARHADEDIDFSTTFFQEEDDSWRHWWQAYYRNALILGYNPVAGGQLLHVASYLGIVSLVRKVLRANAWRISLEFRNYVNQRNKHKMTPLIFAASEGHHDVVQLLLAKGADVNVRGAKGRGWAYTALAAAAEGGHLGVVQLLLANGADPKLPGNDSALKYAAKNRYEHEATCIVRLLLANNADVNIQQNSDRITPLHLAVTNGHETIIQLLLTYGADINIKDKLGRAALQKAVDGNHNGIVQLLLTNSADVNIQDSDRITPLHLAATNGHEAMVRLLLDYGANINIKDKLGRAPLQKAVDGNHNGIVQLLLTNSADVNIQDSDRITPLHLAATNGHEAIIRLLLTYGADINIKDKLGRTALQKAVYGNHNGIVQLLLTNGADANIKAGDDGYGIALSKAAYSGHEAIIRLLLANGADFTINLDDKYTENALSAAARRGHEAIVRLLLANSADIIINDKYHPYGENALYNAANSGHEAIVRLLLENGFVFREGDSFNEALAVAAGKGREAIVKLLLANVAHADIDYSKALTWAAVRGRDHILRMLLENGADVNARHLLYGIWYTALEIAVANDRTTTVQLLLANGARNASTNDTEKASRTALDLAVQRGHEDMVQLLIACTDGVSCADLIKTLHGTLVGRGRIDMAQLLLANGVSHTVSMEASRLAKRGGHEDSAQLLLAHGVSRADLVNALRLAMREWHANTWRSKVWG